AIRDVNLQIDSGQTIGVIGGTGSGKSTLAALIARLYDPNEGTVSVGGEDVCRYDPVELRKDVAIVLQGDTLFSGSILDNLRWGDPTATPEACKEACRIAQIDDFISQLPEGYQTHVNQGGSNLSGGQRQRLCIARALIKRPKILILDDATSACDAQTDRKIHHAMRDALPGTTKIIIAQRIQTVSHADRIIVMQSGRVIGFDTHEQLLADNRLYRDIYEAQTQTNADFDESV
ncbi:MAG: ABC transporter ATP-binding protein, partial [Paludibacteraceae bacterium]|nr:ABC transporter ATP-binding protein [Paludibacteraceae bacterium]